jgi:glycosyltransferase involved in cell wall biosynthesis
MNHGTAPGGILMTMHRMSQGGADRVAVLLANGFVAAGIPTELALLRDGGEGEQTLRGLLDPEVAVRSAGPAMGSRHLELLRGLKFIRREIENISPAIVLASSSNMGLVTGLASRSYRGKALRFAMKLTNPVIRPQDHGRLRTAYRHALYGFIFDNYELVMTLTDAERLELSALYQPLAGRFRTVANAYISDEMLVERPAPRPDGPPNILTLARMMPQKRLDVLLRAFAELRLPEARLTILGDGPLRGSLQQLAQSLGIAPRVDMPGFVEDVVPWLRVTDLFVLSSDYEGLPAAMLEALACNVPVVTTDCFAGARAMFAAVPSCAVTPVADVNALARAIETCLARHETPSGLRAIAKDYGVEASIAAHIAALRPSMASA